VRRHYSTWDVLAVVYWPRAQRATLDLLATRIHLLHRLGERSLRTKHQKHRRASRSTSLTVACVLLVLAGLTLFVGFVDRQPPSERYKIYSTPGILLLIGLLWSNLTDVRNRSVARYMTARRLREHNLTTLGPTAFAAYAPPSLRTRELEERRADALALLSSIPPMRGLAAHAAGLIHTRVFLVIVAVGCASISAGEKWIAAGEFAYLNSLLVMATAAGLVVLLASTLLTLRSRATRALRHSACPDCGYPLADVPPTPSTLQPTLNLGPKRCPECGSPWPLIPLTLDSRPLNATASPTPAAPPPPPRASPGT
jgi:hypothetical protein